MRCDQAGETGSSPGCFWNETFLQAPIGSEPDAGLALACRQPETLSPAGGHRSVDYVLPLIGGGLCRLQFKVAEMFVIIAEPVG